MTLMGNRRKAREMALQILYQMDVQDAFPQADSDGNARRANPAADEQALGLFWKHLGPPSEGEGAARGADPEEAEIDGPSRAFCDELVRGVRARLADIDALIGRASRNWRIERMARVDRNLIRLAVWELKYSKDVPVKVAINEAIEIAKRYGTAESPAFVNGILDRCLEEVGAK